jgi:hypothetical protein
MNSLTRDAISKKKRTVMNRQQRRRAQAMARKQTRSALPDNHHTDVAVELSDDIKRDIAKVVRSIEFELQHDAAGATGMCFWRCMTGWTTLLALGIPAKPALGGMVYRAGPDERCDVVAYCGPGNVGRLTPQGLLAHYFIVSGDNIVDFSVGDWKEHSLTGLEIVLPGTESLPPVCWTAPPLPEFFWTDRRELTPDRSTLSPELGRAWYTGFVAEGTDDPAYVMERLIEDVTPQIKSVMPFILRGIEHYALKERLFAVREGHTAVRFSQLAEIVGDPTLMEQAKQHERLIVLRGKVDVTPKIARETLAEAGIGVVA